MISEPLRTKGQDEMTLDKLEREAVVVGLLATFVGIVDHWFRPALTAGCLVAVDSAPWRSGGVLTVKVRLVDSRHKGVDGLGVRETCFLHELDVQP